MKMIKISLLRYIRHDKYLSLKASTAKKGFSLKKRQRIGLRLNETKQVFFFF